MKTKTVYFGSGWFNEPQVNAYNDAMKALEQNVTVDLENSYIPKDNQYKVLLVEEHPELLEDREWATATYNGDITGIKTSDLVLAVYIPSLPDDGLAMEIGFAKAINKQIVVVIPDEEFGEALNLMIWGGGTNFIRMSELADYNFNKPKFNYYEGAVY